MKKIYALTLIFIYLIGAAAYSAALGQQNAPGPSPVEVNIKLRGIDGKMYDISEMKGSVLLVSFGIPKTSAIAIALTFRFFDFWLPVLLGAASLLILRRSPVGRHEPAAA